MTEYTTEHNAIRIGCKNLLSLSWTTLNNSTLVVHITHSRSIEADGHHLAPRFSTLRSETVILLGC
jgi:hypothetical protein